MAPKLTAWFPVEIKPVREGIYECRCDDGTLPYPFHLWKDNEWHGAGSDPDDPSIIFEPGASLRFDHMRYLSWRGLAERP